MSSFAMTAILLRRVDFGDYDLIIHFYTIEKGKVSVIAKSAKKSTKRFAGILELFSVLDIVCSKSRSKGLPVLTEAILKYPFANIRSNIIKTAYASYWAELINEWMEEAQKQRQLFYLFRHVLEALDLGRQPESALSIIFQMRFMTISGLHPNLSFCSICQTEIGQIRENNCAFDIGKGGIVCSGCAAVSARKLCLSKGTIKQLLWVKS
ncbi:MAG: DNA repair protein RecO, partial [Proteobacteria bacterium]|nr:DNA repair protein RecO [Pseudomonadota bacterium]